jgi:hypothetical protein
MNFLNNPEYAGLRVLVISAIVVLGGGFVYAHYVNPLGGRGLVYSGYPGDDYGYGTTTAILPVVQTVSPLKVVGSSDANLEGLLISDGGEKSLWAGFEYGPTPTYGSHVYTSVPSTRPAPYSIKVLSLSCGTKYYYRAYAKNSAGTAYGAPESFTPACPGLTVFTEAATRFTLNGATLIGSYSPTIATTFSVNTGFEYGTTTSYGSTVSTGVSWSYFTKTLTGLVCGTTYHYRAIVTVTPPGITYKGGDLTFTTLGGTPTTCKKPVVTTDTPVTISYVPSPSATINGTLTYTGGTPATVGFNYGLTTSYGMKQTPHPVRVLSAPGSFTVTVASMTCGKTYHYQAFATNSSDTGFGVNRTFMAPCPPVASTTTLTALASTSATLKSTVSTLGGWSKSVTAGFEWGTTTAYTGGTSSMTSIPTAPTSFTATIGSLVSKTTYHARAVFVDGTTGYKSYGPDFVFTTR